MKLSAEDRMKLDGMELIDRMLKVEIKGLEDYEITFLIVALEHYRESALKHNCNFLVKQSIELIQKFRRQIK